MMENRFVYIPPESSEPLYKNIEVRFRFTEVPSILRDSWIINVLYCKGRKWPRRYYKRKCKHLTHDNPIKCANKCRRIKINRIELDNL